MGAPNPNSGGTIRSRGRKYPHDRSGWKLGANLWDISFSHVQIVSQKDHLPKTVNCVYLRGLTLETRHDATDGKMAAGRFFMILPEARYN